MEACDGCWYELMVGKLLFTSPLVVSCDYELVYTAEGCITEMGVRKAALDNFLLAALRNDFMEMLAISRLAFFMCQKFFTPFFTAFF